MNSNAYRGYVWITEILEVKEGKITDKVIDKKYNFRVYTWEGAYIERSYENKDFSKFLKEYLDTATKNEVMLSSEKLSYDPPPDYKTPKEKKNWRERSYKPEEDFKKI
jgi:hypothetical protein